MSVSENVVQREEVEVSTESQTVEKLQQYYLFIPGKFKEVYLVHILNELVGNSMMIFCMTCDRTVQTALLLRYLGFMAVPLHGRMPQNERLAALTKFKAKNCPILICTDVISRVRDIPHVDVVINFDPPFHGKVYIRRLGRTAGAGRSGRSITFVTQYDIEFYVRIEHFISKELPLYSTKEDEVMLLLDRVAEAQRMVKIELEYIEDNKKLRKRKNRQKDADEDDDTEQSSGVRKRLERKNFWIKGKKGE